MNISLNAQLVMGIVNITPDSFYAGSAHRQEKEILQKVEKHLLEGADIIDIGAQSTRPQSTQISQEEELQRLIKPLKIIRKTFPKIYLSVDTFYGEVAYQSICESVNMINDISAGSMDKTLIDRVAQFPHIDYVLMHMQGSPQTMQEHPQYKNVVDEVYHFFEEKINLLQQKNIHNIILDVGFGFGKKLDDNYRLLKHLSQFKKLGKPLLVGVSRKGMISKLLDITAENALNATTAVNVIALLQGAHILRVHDVKEAKECIRIVEAFARA